MNRQLKTLGVVVLMLALCAGLFAAGQSEGAAEGTPVTIDFWYHANVADPTNPQVLWHQGNLDTFATANPQIRINPTVVSDGDEYLNKITTSMAAGNAPDIFQTWLSGRLEPFVTAGRVHPLDGIIDANAQLKRVLNTAFLDTATFGGKIYALPTILSAEVVFYNKAIFRTNGVSVPTGWDELMAVVKTLRSNGVQPFALGNSNPWPGSIPYMAIFDRLHGPELYRKVVIDHEALWDDPAFIQAGEYLAALRDAGAYPENANSIHPAEGRATFAAGKAAMRFIGTWELAELSRSLGDDLGFFNFPDIPGGKGSARAGWILNKDNGYAISAESSKKDAAAELLKHLFSQERQRALAENGTLIAAVNIEYDTSKVPEITNQLNAVFAQAEYSIVPWDNPLGVNMGREFNLTTQSILGGEKPAVAFSRLQKIARTEWK